MFSFVAEPISIPGLDVFEDPIRSVIIEFLKVRGVDADFFGPIKELRPTGHRLRVIPGFIGFEVEEIGVRRGFDRDTRDSFPATVIDFRENEIRPFRGKAFPLIIRFPGFGIIQGTAEGWETAFSLRDFLRDIVFGKER